VMRCVSLWGSVISLVRESSVVKFRKQREITSVQSITGAHVKLKGRENLRMENALEPLNQECCVLTACREI
jgi:hypothetical protein